MAQFRPTVIQRYAKLIIQSPSKRQNVAPNQGLFQHYNLDIDDFDDWVLLMTIISNAEPPEPNDPVDRPLDTSALERIARRFLRGEGQKSY